MLDDLQEAAAEEPSKAESSRCDPQIGKRSMKRAVNVRAASSLRRHFTNNGTRSKVVARQRLTRRLETLFSSLDGCARRGLNLVGSRGARFF